MKTQRRHELHENVLGNELRQVAEFIKKHGNAIAWGVLIIALIVFVIVYARSRAQQKTARLHLQYDQATTDPTLTPDDRVRLLEELLHQDDEEAIAAMVAIDLGDEFARRMILAGPEEDPAEWKRLSEKAAGYYWQVLDRFADQRAAIAKAHLGLAKLAETRRDFDTARTEYQTILKMVDLTGQPVLQQAEEDLKKLDLLVESVRMATTAPTQPAEEPAEEPAEQNAAPVLKAGSEKSVAPVPVE